MTGTRLRRSLRRQLAPHTLFVACVTAMASASLAQTAEADFGLVPNSFRAGVSTTQAGAHPDASTSFALNMKLSGAPDGNPKDIVVDLPPGIVGNPQATPRCDSAGILAVDLCPRDTMVGVVYLDLVGFPTRVLPVFNIEPSRGQPAAFVFRVFNETLVRLDATVREDGDYGLKVNIGNANQRLSVAGSRLIFWGVPADHNGPGTQLLDFADVPTSFGFTFGGRGGGPRLPFMTNPSECGVPGITKIAMNSWAAPNTWVTADSEPTVLDGCEKLTFEPTLDLRPDNQRAGAPAGLAVDLGVPQNQNPDGLATPPLKDATVTLPQGMSISPSAADGLQGCTDDQVGLRRLGPAECPQASRIGAVTVESPLLPDPLTGSIFLGSQKSNDASTGDLVRMFLVVEGAGVRVKLEGKVFPDLRTGQVKAVFRNNPQLPFHLLKLRFNGGPRASLANPQSCGTHTYSSTLTSWGGQSRTQTGSYTITQDVNGRACGALGFNPSFSAGMLSADAGKSSTFSLTFGRDDSQQDLNNITVAMPPGLTGVIAASDVCSNAAADAGTCGEAARVGNVTTAAGPGTNPFYLPGRVYITEAYKDAPFGLSIVVPAVAGPFDLGNVVVRAAIYVDRVNASLRVVAEPLPTMLQGIPLRVRTVNVRVDKPGFMVNPTDCTQKQVAARITSTAGAAADVGARFRVSDCAVLPFKPSMQLKVGSRGRTRPEVTTPFEALLKMSRGQANVRSVSVVLPKTLNARLEVVNVRNACTMEQYQTDRCPRTVGTAVAVTPLLRDPLKASVYLVRNPARRIPDMMVPLRGQGVARFVRVDLTGKITIPKDLSVRTDFDTAPDVPITSFKLKLTPGRNGAVGVVRNLCVPANQKRTVARLAFIGHNGRRVERSQRIKINGCGAPKERRAGARRNRTGR